MACVLGTGFTLDCRRSIGGVKEVYIGELENIASVTVSAGVVSAMSMSASKKFYKYELRKNTSEGKADNAGDVNNGSGYIMQSVQIQLDKFETAKNNEIRVLAQKPIVAIVGDKNGTYFVYGLYNGLDLTTGTAGTGKEANSLNGYNLTFTGEELDYPPSISSTIINTLI